MENQKKNNNEFENPVAEVVNEQPKTNKKGLVKKLAIGLGLVGIGVAGGVVGHRCGYKKGYCAGAVTQAIADRVAPGKEGEVEQATGLPVANRKKFGDDVKEAFISADSSRSRWF